MDNKFGLSIVDNGHHRRETRYQVEQTAPETYIYTIYRRHEGSWQDVGRGMVEHCGSMNDFVNAIAIRLGPSDYEWEPMGYDEVLVD